MAANHQRWTGVAKANLGPLDRCGDGCYLLRQRIIVAGPERRAIPANYCRWLGSAMAATGVVITASCTVAAMAANYSGWTGAVHNASCTTPPLRQWLRTTAAGLVCGFCWKLPRLDWCGDGCKQATAAKLVRRWLQTSAAGLVRRWSRLKIKNYVQHDDNRIIIINYVISSHVNIRDTA